MGYLLKFIRFLSICKHSLVAEMRKVCFGFWAFWSLPFYLPFIIGGRVDIFRIT